MSGAPASAPPPAALTAEEAQEFAELRRENKVLRAENAVLQRRLDEERSQRRQGPEGDNHYRLEAKACREAITGIDPNTQVLALYDELHRLRRKCDVYAEAVEESRSYFFEMKRLYTEVEPHLRSSGGNPSAAAATATPSDYMGIMFLCTSVMSFNAGIWQIFRRGQKKQLMENHKNMEKTPLTDLPPEKATVNDCEYRRVRLDGSFDNEGSCLVGPRSIPSYKGAANADESRGGFLIMTPFEVANTGEFVMVNRGWVPIDAGKHRTMLTQYIGEGFATGQVRGILRKEEFMGGSLLWGPSPDNEGPVAADLSWLAMRPWNMAVAYYRRRWGPEALEQRVRQHGAHHYYVEMLEDFSGDDQRMVRGHAWPRRREVDEATYVHLTPVVHSMYVLFWFSVSAGSLYGMLRCWRRQKDLFALRKFVNTQAMQLETKRQAESKAYLQAVEEVERLKKIGTAAAAAQIDVSSGSPSSPSNAASEEERQKRANDGATQPHQ